MNINSKNDGKKSFSYETKAPMSSNRENEYMVPNHEKRRRLLCESMFIPIDKMNFNSKEWWKEKLFLWNQSINAIYPKEENKLMVPNLEKKENYYVNPCLSWMTMNFNSKNDEKISFSNETKALMSFSPLRRMNLWCPIMKKMRLLYESVFVPIDRWSLTLKMMKR